MEEPYNQASVKLIPSSEESNGGPAYVGTVGDPMGIEVIAAGRKGEWHPYGIRGFGVGFLQGDSGYELSKQSIRLLDEAVERYESEAVSEA